MSQSKVRSKIQDDIVNMRVELKELNHRISNNKKAINGLCEQQAILKGRQKELRDSIDWSKENV